MSLFDILHLSSGAMQVNQAALRVTANNIANAGTEGYHRQSPDLHTVGSSWTRGLLLGRGVTIADVVSAYDSFTDQRLMNEHANSGFADQLATAMQSLEALVATTGSGSLADRASSLFNDFDAVAADPTDISLRTQLLHDAEALAEEFSRQAGELANAAAEANDALAWSVRSVSQRFAEIASLNGQIAAREAAGQSANDLRDERSRLADEVATMIGVTVDEEDDGSLTVLVAGHAVVQGTEARTLTTTVDPNTGFNRVVIQDGALPIDITAQITTGEMAAYLAIRNEIVPAQLADLDQIAYDLMTGINAVHAVGYGLDGVTGRDLFAAPAAVSGAALAMAVDAAVAGDPDAVAAAADPANLPGDGSNAAALGDLTDAPLTSGGTRTILEAMSDFVGHLASDVASADAAQALQDEITSAVQSLWDTRSGVSLEEEAVDLMKYQDSYEAMARVLQVTQQMLDTLMELP